MSFLPPFEQNNICKDKPLQVTKEEPLENVDGLSTPQPRTQGLFRFSKWRTGAAILKIVAEKTLGTRLYPFHSCAW